jgi:AMME syndrome candidate gene 1 protein
MATKAHCAYAFECLASNFERRQPLSLAQVEELWDEYHASNPMEEDEDEDGEPEAEEDEDADMTDAEAGDPAPPRPAAISKLLNRETAPSAGSSNSSLPSTKSMASSVPSSRQSGSGVDTPASSRSSLFALGRRLRNRDEEHPLFVTWNTVSRSGYKSLRGCIGTFEPQELEYGLRSYALTRYAGGEMKRYAHC